MKNTLPAFSVIIEWESARLSEIGRARDMLNALSSQVAALKDQLAAPPELIVLYSPHAIDPALIQSLIGEAFDDRGGVETRLLPTENGTYYRQKNYGASLAKHDLVMFLDSDVVLEADWLAKLIGSFADPKSGSPVVTPTSSPTGVYSKAFALFWFFPLRSKTSGLSPSTHFFANNVVFRRDLFLDYQFPDLPCLRGQCIALAHRLSGDGHRIYIQNEARVSHPPPNGLSHFVKRALCEGHDHVHRSKAGEGTSQFLRGALGRYRRSLSGSSRRIWRARREVGLGPIGAAAGTAVAFGYYTLALVVEAMTQANPHLIRDRFSV